MSGRFRLFTNIISTKCSFELNDAQGHFAGPLYVFIDDIVRLVFPFGRGYLMVNTVIKNAFRIIPMIPLDYHLLQFSWNGNCYFDMFLSLNVSSSFFFQIQFSCTIGYYIKTQREGNVSYLRRFLGFFFHQIHNNDLSSFLSLCENTSTPPPLVLIVLRQIL